jgi:ferric-dicitrate binding protein FerR (iron transport regulator)
MHEGAPGGDGIVTMDEKQDKREELFDRYVSDSLSREDVEAIKGLLRDDEEAQRTFFQYVKEIGLTIFTATHFSAASETTGETAAARPRRSVFIRRLAVWGAVAAVLAVAAVASFHYATRPAVRPGTAVTAELGGFTPPLQIMRHTDQLLPEPGMRFAAYDLIRVGDGGKATIIYPIEGSTVNLESGTYATLWETADSRCVELFQGTLEYTSARLSKLRPALITTPSTTARAVGTRFIVSVLGVGTRIQVREGVVELEARDRKQKVLVEAGHNAVAAKAIPIEVEPVPAPVLAAWREEDRRSKGLVGYWPFDEGGGPKAYDYSGHGNHGTIYRATWEDGKIGGAVKIHGGWYVDAGEDSSLKITDHVTMAAWIKITLPLSARGPRRIIGQTNKGVRNYHLYVDGDGKGRWRLHLSNSRKGNLEYAGGTSPYCLERDVWYHVAGVITTAEGGSHRYYVNGELVDVHKGYGFDRLRTDAGRTHIGMPKWAFYGLVDEVRIYNRVLTDDEIAELAAWRPESEAGAGAGEPSESRDSR